MVLSSPHAHISVFHTAMCTCKREREEGGKGVWGKRNGPIPALPVRSQIRIVCHATYVARAGHSPIIAGQWLMRRGNTLDEPCMDPACQLRLGFLRVAMPRDWNLDSEVETGLSCQSIGARGSEKRCARLPAFS